MNLVIFDVDGTLTDTNHIDAICFERALQQEFGVSGISFNWESYQHTTDAGIATEILRFHFGRDPLANELNSVRDRMVRLLEKAHQSNPEDFREICGARTILHSLQQQQDWRIAIATGCWSASALLKLRKAGIEADVPFASCNDSVSRSAIVKSAIHKSRFFYDVRDFTSITFIGDGVWDIAAAQSLGIGFLGIANETKQTRLKAAGAKFVCSKYDPADEFLNCLKQGNGYAPSTGSLSVRTTGE